MKNHIAFKFIAVLLCAASLLGAVGCGLGVFALTDLDLYNKTVDQVYQERVHRYGEDMAFQKALSYAGSTLGGCPEPMMRSMYAHADAPYFNSFYYGYTLKDADGKVLESTEIPHGENITTYTFDVTGQYMHLVDIITASDEVQQLQEEQEAADTQLYEELLEENAVLINDIPPEGAIVTQVTITFADSSVGASGDNIGTVFRNAEDLVVLRCPGFDIGEAGQEVIAIALHDSQGNLIYEASTEHGIGTVSYEAADSSDMVLLFTSYPVYRMTAQGAAAAEATEPETAVAEETAAADATESTAVTEAEEAAEDSTDPTATEETAATEETEAEDETKPEETEAEETKPEETEAEEETKAQEETEAEEETKPEEETTAEEATEAESDAEAAAAKEDSESESAEDGTEATGETVAPTVPETTPAETVPEETVPEETVPEVIEPVMINGRPLNSYQINRTEYFDESVGDMVTARYVYITMPEMTLELHVAPGVLTTDAGYAVLRIVRQFRGYLFPAIGICLLLFAVCLVYLCCAAGRKPKSDEVRPGALNRIPLDAYFLLVCSGIGILCAVIIEGGNYLLMQNVMVGCATGIGLGYLVSLLVVGFLFACAAQFKTPGGFWWRHSLCGLGLKLCLWLLRKAWQLCQRLGEWSEAKGWPLLVRLCKRLWNWVTSLLRRIANSVSRFLHWMQRSFDRFLSLLPVTWQWILIGFAIVFILFITVAGRYDFGIVLAILFAFAMILYGAHCFGVLMEATKKMNKGNLDSQVDDKLMVGSFKEFAGDLNDLANVAVVAARKQLKSERMKTELITNVTHDIKTPLTSIINYVDLLQKPHTDDEQQQYLEVLDRQSQRLKKLVDDLIDMSKASTGNMAVDITLVDAVESVNQALGEFGDKLDRAELIPVFRHTEDTVAMMADGKLVWRVLSNLLSNAVKYAMPGTRLYIDLMSLDNKVVISIKNISRDELNVDAEELMERFVRGDDSRNTEGSGLGLNIAKSLMELQKGQLQLLVDGDLFKVTLIFPGI